MEKLSVIIPALNEKANLETLIPYLCSLTDVEEIIVVEARDTTSSYQSKTPLVKVSQSQYNSRAIQMNEGAYMAKGQIFVFLHADVKPLPTAFAKIKQTIQDGFSFGFFSYNFNPSNTLLNINASFTRKDGIFAGGGDQIHFMTRETFALLSGYDEKFVIMEDFDFSRRIRQMKIPYKIIDLPAIVSSRKYVKNSYLRVNFTNAVALILFIFKVNSVWIRRWCQYMLK